MTQFIASRTVASGNESIGTQWIETAVFPPTATLQEVWDWADRYQKLFGYGLLTLSIDSKEKP